MYVEKSLEHPPKPKFLLFHFDFKFQSFQVNKTTTLKIDDFTGSKGSLRKTINVPFLLYVLIN